MENKNTELPISQNSEEFLKSFFDGAEDTARKWGVEITESNGLIFRPEYIGAKGDLELGISKDEKKQNLTVIRASKAEKGRTPDKNKLAYLPERRVIRLMGSIPYTLLKNEGTVYWDTEEIGVREALTILAQCDEVATEKGLMIGPERIPFSERAIAVPRYQKVDEYFTGNAKVLPLDGKPAETELKKFDHPELLDVLYERDSGTAIGIIRKDDVPYFEERERVINEAFLKRQINPLELAGLILKAPEIFKPFEIAIREEVEKKMKEWLKEHKK